MEYLSVRRLLMALISYWLLPIGVARINEGPDNIGAQVGSNVELKCLFDHGSCNQVVWTETELSGSVNILYAGNSMLQSFGRRYSVNVSPRGECTLRINRVQFSDAGTFTCVDAVSDGDNSQQKKSATIAVAESKPKLEMNATVENIVDGDMVQLSCSLKYRASIQLQQNVQVVIDHPGADKIDSITHKDTDAVGVREIRSDVTVKVKSVKNIEHPTSFGPIQCKVLFRRQSNDASVFSLKSVQFVSDKTLESPISSPVSNIWLDPDSGFSPGKPVTCKANGFPRPSFKWLRASDNTTFADDAKLEVKSANFTYICMATNVVRGQKYTAMSTEVDFASGTGFAVDPNTASTTAVAGLSVHILLMLISLMRFIF